MFSRHSRFSVRTLYVDYPWLTVLNPPVVAEAAAAAATAAATMPASAAASGEERSPRSAAGSPPLCEDEMCSGLESGEVSALLKAD